MRHSRSFHSAQKKTKPAAEVDSASSHQALGGLRTEMQVQKADSLASLFAVTDPLLSGEAEKPQVRQALKESTAVQAYAASDGRVSGRFCRLFGQKLVSRLS